MFSIPACFGLMLAVALSLVYVVTSFNIESGLEEKMTPFECGFDPLSSMRSPFSTRFFLLVVLFLIFDVEVALLFPVLSFFFCGSSPTLLVALLLFITILLVGMFHEWNEGALDWVSN